MFHISDCKKYNRCPILFYKDKTSPIASFREFVRLDEQITTLAMQKLHVEDYFLGERNDPKEKAMEALKEKEWLVKARFEYKSLRVKVPFLHKVKKGYDVYFLFVGLFPFAKDLQFYVDTIWVLENNGIKINDIFIVHLNANYIRGKELDLNELFVISSTFYNDNKNPTTNIKQTIYAHMQDLSSLLEDMEECNEETLPTPIRSSKCTGRQKCIYYDECFHEEEQPYNAITTLCSSRYKYDMQKEGLLYLKDADIERVEGSRLQYAQIQADKNNGLFVDKLALGSWLSKVQYPISFLDFEWERFAIPPYEGMKPFDVLPFEYSLHILEENGEVEHRVFLSVHDDRRELAESLAHDIPKTGSVIAYNAYGAEMVRINEMIETFPDLKAPLESINARMLDLQIPFESGIVYDTRMHGLWSLKVIMSMMDDPGYKALEINQGMDAVYEWRHLDRDEDDVDKNTIIDALKAYCGMDSYAMVVVYKWLKDIVQK